MSGIEALRLSPSDATPWHARDAAEALHHFGVSGEGLDEAEAARRLEQHGPNRLIAEKGRSVVARLLTQFDNPLIYVLIASGVLTAAIGHWADSSVIFGSVVVNALVGFFQEGRAEAAMAAVRSLLAPRANVMRAGVRRNVPAEGIVPGDIVLLEPGDRVPADLRLVTTHGLAVAEAVLTGESVPVDKAPAPTAPEAVLGERSSMVFSGTVVVRGHGVGLAVATGENTEIGRIGRLIRQVEPSAECRTAAVNTLVAFEAFYLLNMRSFHEPSYRPSVPFGSQSVILVIGAVTAFQLMLTYLPALQTLFGTAALSPASWLVIVAMASSVFIIVEVEKWARRAFARSRRRPISG
jgi:magnesium-transporting ATPase (P-type)